MTYCAGSTRNKILHTNYKWTITNFSFFMNDDCLEEMKSPFFFSKDNNTEKVKWYMKLLLKQTDDNLKDFISLYLGTETKDHLIRAKFNFAILEWRKDDGKVRRFKPGNLWGYEKFINRSKIKDLLVIDDLTISCNLYVLDDLSDLFEVIPFKQIEPQALKDFGALLETQLLSDMILAVEGKEFRVHKLILAARSPVFAAMFQHETKENMTNRVDIVDVDADVMAELIRFIYTEKVDNLKTFAPALLPVAEKYLMQSLKDKCEEEMCSQLSIENAAESLVIADLHSTPQLKNQAISFINQNAKQVRETTGWKKLEKYHPQLIQTLYGAIVASLNPDHINPSLNYVNSRV